MIKNQDTAAHERQRKVREWISAQRELQFTAKEAAHAIFTNPTQAEINYVSSVLSRHSKGDDACIHLIGKKHRNGRGGTSEFVYQTIMELPTPRSAFFSSGKSRTSGTRCPRKVDFIDAAKAVAAMDEGVAEFNDAMKEKAERLFKEATKPAPSTTERLLELAIKADRGEPVLSALLALAHDIAHEQEMK